MSSGLLTLIVAAFIVFPSLFFVWRASNRTLGKDATENRAKRMDLLYAMKALGEKLRDEPDSPETPARKVEFARLKAEFETNARAAAATSRDALSGLQTTNTLVTYGGALFLLLVVLYLLVFHFGATSILASAIIIAITSYTVVMNRRSKRARDLMLPRQ